MTKNIALIHGPNLNMLGRREPELYGTQTLADLEKKCADLAGERQWHLSAFQSNYEGALIDFIHTLIDDFDAVLINAGAYTHTSIALHDALKLLKCPIIELHLSDVKNREDFRRISYIAPLAHTVIQGKGADGYSEAFSVLDRLWAH